MQTRKYPAKSQRHKNSKSLQNLHGINAATSADVIQTGSEGNHVAPGDPNHPGVAMCTTAVSS